jgi:small subunit ribosomal protein S15
VNVIHALVRLISLDDPLMPSIGKCMLDKNKKDKIIAKFRTHETDTGSPQVQIAILTAEIKDLSDHLLEHKKDFSSRKGLLRKVSERRRLMKYLKREEPKSYEKLMADLKLE